MPKLNKKFLAEHNIKAAIFDMDGLIIDSEPLWRNAEISAFGSVGVALDENSARETTGMRCDEVVAHWFNKYPWQNPTRKEVERIILDKMVLAIKEKGKALPGIHETLGFFRSNSLPIGIASSSPQRIINTVVDKFEIGKYLSLVHSADDEEFGKPHPGVFIGAAKRMNIRPMNCLVFEDSINGIIAAKAARMKCIAVPAIENFDNPKIQIADFKVRSLEELH